MTICIRISKESAIKAAIRLVPEYVELLQDLQRGGGRFCFSPRLSQIQQRFGEYVLMYDNELKINRCLLMALMGVDGYKGFKQELEAASLEEQQACIDEVCAIDDELFDETLAMCRIPETEEDEKAAQEALAAMPEDEQKNALQQGAFLFMFLFSHFFNTLSLMVHGATLTSLVARALDGDDKAFLQAVQIDRMLLLHYPFFRERKRMAQDAGETKFLNALFYRESNPVIRGKIRFPALYMLFGILDAYHWLDDLRHEEILDICDEAGLDRYQNRIEDVGYLTKRLGEYRKWQKSASMSMS